MTNIIDGMDNARFQSGNVKEKKSVQKKGNESRKENAIGAQEIKKWIMKSMDFSKANLS